MFGQFTCDFSTGLTKTVCKGAAVRVTGGLLVDRSPVSEHKLSMQTAQSSHSPLHSDHA